MSIWVTEQEKKMVEKLVTDIEVTMMFGDKHSEITRLHQKVYDQLILRLATNKISKKRYDKLNELNDTRDLENMNMVAKILLADERKENTRG
jgi:hypothetical protein